MSDLDVRLARSLERVASSYTPGAISAARETFLARRRRRRVTRVVGSSVAAAALVALVASGSTLLQRDISFEGGDPGVPRGNIEVTETFSVGTGPVDVAVDEDTVYVAHAEGGRAFAIDPRSGEARLQIPSIEGDGPSAIAVGEGRIFGANRATGAVTAYDLNTGIPVQEAAAGLPDPTDVAFGAGFVWVASSDPKGPADRYVVTQHVPESLERVRIVPVPGIAHLEYGYGYLWAATSGGLFRIDPESGDALRVPGLGSASDASAGFGSIWAYEDPKRGGLRAGLSRIDPTRARVVEQTVLEGFFGNVEAHEGTGIWVLSSVQEYERNLLRIDPRDGAILGEPLPIEGGLVEMAPGFGGLWLTDESQATLRRVEVVNAGG
jgi:hypothetical protein